MTNLQPLGPSEAVEMYLQSREPEVSVKTLQNHRYRLSHFVAWCREEEIENLNRLTGRMLHQYRTWRAEQVKRVTLVNELRTVQQFLGFAASIDGVEEGMRERVRIPPLDPEEEARDVRLETERAQEILTHMERYEYASRDHVIMLLLWHSGIRLGTLRSIDVDDFDSDGRCIDIRHRPESETPLKNGDAAERAISVSEHYCKVLDDYIEHNRHNVRDDYGRRPLISSQHGRLSSAPIRQAVYQWTLPCTIGSCPHDQDPDTCEWAVRDSRAGCPSSRSPHAIRRGAITHQLRNHVPQNVVEERSNVSGEVLEQHYDQRTEREKMEVRREFLDALDSDTEGTR